MEKDDPKMRRPDLSLIKNIIELNGIKYEKIKLENGMLKTFEYFIDLIKK